MDKFVCLGDVRKGISPKQARAIFHLPDKVTMIFGQPQEPEGKTKAMYWGVWVPEEQCCDAETGKIIPRGKIFWQGITILVLMLFILPLLLFHTTDLNVEGSCFVATPISVTIYFILWWWRNKSSTPKMAK
jgi:hypothetical protein